MLKIPHMYQSLDRCDTQAIEPLEASKRNDAPPHSEESGSSNADRHWKRLKKYPPQLVMLHVIH